MSSTYTRNADGTVTLSLVLDLSDLGVTLPELAGAADNCYESYRRGADDDAESELAEQLLGPLAHLLGQLSVS